MLYVNKMGVVCSTNINFNSITMKAIMEGEVNNKKVEICYDFY